MSARKGRGAKVRGVPADKRDKPKLFDDMDSSNLSSIDKASFLEGLRQNSGKGNPLHSTALEEDLNISQVDVRGKSKTTAEQRGAAEQRKQTETNKKKVKAQEERKRSTGAKARPQRAGEGKTKKGEPEGKTESGRLVGKKPKTMRSVGNTLVERPVKNEWVKKNVKKKSRSDSGESSDSQSQKESDIGTTQRSHNTILSSYEDMDEDFSPNPGSKAKVYNVNKKRKSSSGSSSAEPEKPNAKKRSKTPGRQGDTDLEVVLDAFLDYCEQYRESVESKAVRHNIEFFAINVKQQLQEKITSNKEISLLKRENAKLGSLINKKTKKLLDAKNELMRAERQMWLLQKEKNELKLRLSNLKQTNAFLNGIKDLNQQYLDYRHRHPEAKETYGASSLPALLLETNHIQTVEKQLRRINNQMEKMTQRQEV